MLGRERNYLRHFTDAGVKFKRNTCAKPRNWNHIRPQPITWRRIRPRERRTVRTLLVLLGRARTKTLAPKGNQRREPDAQGLKTGSKKDNREQSQRNNIAIRLGTVFERPELIGYCKAIYWIMFPRLVLLLVL